MNRSHEPKNIGPEVNRRIFLKRISIGSAVAGGVVLGTPPTQGQEKKEKDEEAARRRPPEVETNIQDFMKVPKAKGAIPGPCPGKVVEVKDLRSLDKDKVNGAVVREMVKKGITRLTGKGMKESFALFFDKDDVVGLKVNPVGPVINTRPEVVEAVIEWLTGCGLPRENIVIWDRFEPMLGEVGFTPERFPGVKIEGLQVLDMKRKPGAPHASRDRFDKEAFYYAKGIVGKAVPGYKDDKFYLDQHVFNGEYSYFGKLVTKRLTKIVNLAAFKNTGNGISMATKNLGYGSLCNTGRLHRPLFFRVCTEVLAAPWIRDKLVLNITDALRGQYEGGPGFNGQFVYPNHTLYFATDPFAADMVCHRALAEKRKAMKVRVDENPRYTEYLHYGERLGLGVADPKKIEHVRITA